jgi:glyoxylase I family protein
MAGLLGTVLRARMVRIEPAPWRLLNLSRERRDALPSLPVIAGHHKTGFLLRIIARARLIEPSATTGPAPTALGSLQPMAIRLENVGIAVRDLEATIAFFTDLGLTVVGRDTVSGEWTDTAVGLDNNHAKIAMLQTPDGQGRLELFEYIHPEAIESEPTRPNEIGMHRVAFSVDNIDKALEIAARHGCHPLRGVATYKDIYKLTYLRGPSGILVMLAEELKKN